MSEAKETAGEAAAAPGPGATAPEETPPAAPTSSTAGEAPPASPASSGEATPPAAAGADAETQATPSAAADGQAAPDATADGQGVSGSDAETQAAPGAAADSQGAPESQAKTTPGSDLASQATPAQDADAAIQAALDAISAPPAAAETQAAPDAAAETKAAPGARPAQQGDASPSPAAADKTQAAPPAPLRPGMEPLPGSMQELMAAGVHFGHQTRRWNPKMKPYIFGERGGVHIIDLDHTVPMLKAAMAFLCEVTAQGDRVLFVATKRQARTVVKREAERAGQFYVNNRWLGGMLTNFRTVRRSIERFKGELQLLGDEERISEFSKKERSRLSRSVGKYRKSLDGLKDMEKLPKALFVIDLNKEHIAVSEAARLGIPVVAVVDTNCDPERVDFPVPGNDDSARAVKLYCRMAADACLHGAEMFNQRVTQQSESDEAGVRTLPSGRRVVELQQQQAPAASGRRERGARPWRARQAGGSFSAGGRGDEASGQRGGKASAAAAGAKSSAPAASGSGAAQKAPRKAKAKKASGAAGEAAAEAKSASETKAKPAAEAKSASETKAKPAEKKSAATKPKQAEKPKSSKQTKPAPDAGAAPAENE